MLAGGEAEVASDQAGVVDSCGAEAPALAYRGFVVFDADDYGVVFQDSLVSGRLIVLVREGMSLRNKTDDRSSAGLTTNRQLYCFHWLLLSLLLLRVEEGVLRLFASSTEMGVQLSTPTRSPVGLG